jgi:hypothetical protein
LTKKVWPGGSNIEKQIAGMTLDQETFKIMWKGEVRDITKDFTTASGLNNDKSISVSQTGYTETS